MKTHHYFSRLAIAGLTLLLAPGRIAAQGGHMHTPNTPNAQKGVIPASIRAEHEEIHATLVEATRAPGRIGVAAKAVADVLHPHFVREEQVALPPLGALALLARGDMPDNADALLAMSDSLKAELPKMLDEHKAIRAAVEELGRIARAAGAAKYVQLAEHLAQHALNEEEVLYPAAILVGDLIRARAHGGCCHKSPSATTGG